LERVASLEAQLTTLDSERSAYESALSQLKAKESENRALRSDLESYRAEVVDISEKLTTITVTKEKLLHELDGLLV
jgi:uncharacterized protein YlxW (UPF0749 family)